MNTSVKFELPLFVAISINLSTIRIMCKQTSSITTAGAMEL